MEFSNESQAASAGSRAAALPARRRKVFYLLDSLGIGGTETQAVELARRLDRNQYDVTFACLRAVGPLRERLGGMAVEEFYPKGGINSVQGVYQMMRLSAFLRR